jgi:hypothetical protein
MVGAWLWNEPFFESAFAHRLYRVALAALCSVWLVELFAGCCKAVYGREMVLWSLGLQVRSHSSPDHAGRLSIITLPYIGRRGLLRHAMYDHESTASAIRLWVQQGFMLWPVKDEEGTESPQRLVPNAVGSPDGPRQQAVRENY